MLAAGCWLLRRGAGDKQALRSGQRGPVPCRGKCRYIELVTSAALLQPATNENTVASPTRVNCSTQLRRAGHRRGGVPAAQTRFPLAAAAPSDTEVVIGWLCAIKDPSTALSASTTTEPPPPPLCRPPPTTAFSRSPPNAAAVKLSGCVRTTPRDAPAATVQPAKPSVWNRASPMQSARALLCGPSPPE